MMSPLSPRSFGQPLWHILRNHEGRFALARHHHPVPRGWQSVSAAMPHEAALEDLRLRWSDMRPLSLQEVQP
ncbi:MbtH family NRPS accessory protein [Thioclava sp. BHET1]|uniref:Antibiotic synthesis protein MbtH n=2 Tax=Thioclava dalianensis TaxID=1185766 RepID=A0A074T9F6_9RHOB|nr:MbtH family NRPS accessory protein [Thioclava dalianensis]KEP68309.1 antibiotic synthesis protein MbtH [Thioclava dalianensis]TMV88056.1 MbtH family NRPS accessory protein [Thioclava sp. BHET1]SFN80945.1 Uncharacterized conserved protein YbdZ, MbtH family [Thioclava dalianensis]